MKRRTFLRYAAAGPVAFTLGATVRVESALRSRPNIILRMADDQGWGDTGYNGHPVLQTPTMDAMARAGIRFNRFYSAAPVCSPTRGSCLTGRHPYRYGIFHANEGHMKPQEVTLAEVLKGLGYRTGHFGKWHLGTLTRTVKDSNRGGPEGAEHYSPPWENGFDVCFSTEAKVPTWNPMVDPKTGTAYGTRYWREDGAIVDEDLEGDDSRIIMDRAIPFLRRAIEAVTPFFAVIWFHAPHMPVVSGGKYLAMYEGQPDERAHYYGCITAMDEQLGRLREELCLLGATENTMVWFCSDNGPEGQTGSSPGTTGGLRGRKRDLFEGGIRVPGVLEWPARVVQPFSTSVPCCTSDFFPTICNVLGVAGEDGSEPVDGIDLMPLIEGRMTQRPHPMAFESGNQLALLDNRYKTVSLDGGRSWMLFDLAGDPGEERNLADEMPELVQAMREKLESWRTSCANSRDGQDYGGSN